MAELEVRPTAKRFLKMGTFEIFTGVFSKTIVAEAKGCCATTNMWKVELELEFNFLSGSGFLSRLVGQVISVPFVVQINTPVAPRQLVCLMKVSLKGFY